MKRLLLSFVLVLTVLAGAIVPGLAWKSSSSHSKYRSQSSMHRMYKSSKYGRGPSSKHYRKHRGMRKHAMGARAGRGPILK